MRQDLSGMVLFSTQHLAAVIGAATIDYGGLIATQVKVPTSSDLASRRVTLRPVGP